MTARPRTARRATHDVALALSHTTDGGGTPVLAGRVMNIRLAPLDVKRLEPRSGEPWLGRSLALDAGARSPGNAWSGAVAATDGAGLDGFPAPNAFLGDWQAAVHGPEAVEVAGRLRLWTPLAEGADAAVERSGQAVAVAGFGAVRAR